MEEKIGNQSSIKRRKEKKEAQPKLSIRIGFFKPH